MNVIYIYIYNIIVHHMGFLWISRLWSDISNEFMNMGFYEPTVRGDIQLGRIATPGVRQVDKRCSPL